MKELALSVKNLSFQYPNQPKEAIRNVTFHVYKGEWVAIVGHNGSGKSTVAKLLIGLLKPKSGEIRMFDTVLNEETVWDIRKRTGIVFQNPDNQFVGTTVQDDVAFGLENNGVPREQMIERVRAAIQQVGMEEFLLKEPHYLSGGQKQRVAIAGVIALEPDLIILDEATSMLDPKGRREVLAVIDDLRAKQQMTVISITHDLEEAVRADQIIVMNEGEIIAKGTPLHIFSLGEKLEEIRLDLPFVMKVRKELQKAGLPLSFNSVTFEELVDELWTLYLNK
ncbi:energy-coupling factor ABC transporter ATP-binding protein [Anoxybacillus sp. J5B_2022]|uniref:energy-coupling factor ABC transporter ATP-binding protein n=1 Tax=Anoxybacillus sp. J5B_2022 TaxID=3003246 RepID=UPI0022869D55|nr:energy-coupling factor ABC transporter ATP-binding protein [Anoxybacillus sp. J5B_2022]MCZ0755228.1 energy-coupling factor ABC transporter ATP-binding protein [Anoxybacillus sp. J5B_2022]